MSFEKLFDAVENLDVVLDDGPADCANASEEFLEAVQRYARDVDMIAKELTVADVDAEFTEEGDSNVEENEEG